MFIKMLKILLFSIFVFCGILPLVISNSQAFGLKSTFNKKYIEIPKGASRPGVGLSIQKDGLDGLDLYVVVENFIMGPPTKTWPRQKRVVQGHAQLYINGVKVSRIYSPWFHIKSNYLSNNINDILVTLNDHNQKNWVLDGKVIQAKLQLSFKEPKMKVEHHSSAPLIGKRRVH